jgi:penicillin-binding protein activator
MRLNNIFLLIGMVFAATGCVTTGNSPQGRVAMVDTGERNRLEAKLTMTDLMSTAERLTDKMLASDQVQSWGDTRPRLILGKIRNRSDVDNIPEEEIYDRIQAIILASGVARIVDKNAVNFDYILSGNLGSTTQKGEGGEELRLFRITLKLSNKEGEVLGSWQDNSKGFAKAKKPLF